MNYTTLSSWGPEKTPATIKHLIITTCCIAIASAAIQDLFDLFDIFPGPQSYLSLSWWGLQRGYLWQLFSFIFVQETSTGLSFSFLVALTFSMLILWSIGSAILDIIGKASFLRLYFFGTFAAAILTLLSILITGQYETIAGITPALIILLTVWAMAFPETEILLFFLIPVKAKWLVISVIGAFLLISLSHLDFSSLFLYLFATLIGYGYAVMAHSWYSPFAFTLPFDLWLSRIASFIRRHNPLPKKTPKDVKSSEIKIIDLSSRHSSLNDDDAFVDAMLTKISKRGEESLSRSERQRLQNISNKKMREH